MAIDEPTVPLGPTDVDGNVKVIPPAPAEYEPADLDEDEAAPHGRDVDGNPLAPYGLRVDGTPRKAPGGRRAGSGAGSPRRKRARKRAPRAAPRPPRASTSPKAAPKPAGPNYAEGFAEILDLVAGLIDIGARTAARNNPQLGAVLTADAQTIKIGKTELAPVLGELAAEVPAIAALVERAQATGPYTKLLLALAPLGMQLAVNHGMAQPGPMGTVAPEELLIRSGRYAPAPPSPAPAAPGYAA